MKLTRSAFEEIVPADGGSGALEGPDSPDGPRPFGW
jgi:hypothetical protein